MNEQKSIEMNEERVLEVLEQGCPYWFEDLSKELQNKPKIILAYAKHWPDDMYKRKRDFFRSKRKYMIKLLKSQCFSISLLEKEDFEDDEYMKIALINHPTRIIQLHSPRHKAMLRGVIDEELALYLVRSRGFYLEYLDEYQNNEKVVLEAYRNSEDSIKYASPRLQYQLQNITFKKEYDVDEVVLQSTLKTVQADLATLKEMREQVKLYLNQIDTLVERVEQNLESCKVKQKMPNEKRTDETV